jgi:L-rhamnose isomerase
LGNCKVFYKIKNEIVEWASLNQVENDFSDRCENAYPDKADKFYDRSSYDSEDVDSFWIEYNLCSRSIKTTVQFFES